MKTPDFISFLSESRDNSKVMITITSKRKFLVLAACKKKRKFFEERTHIRELPLSTINITNSGERG